MRCLTRRGKVLSEWYTLLQLKQIVRHLFSFSSLLPVPPDRRDDDLDHHGTSAGPDASSSRAGLLETPKRRARMNAKEAPWAEASGGVEGAGVPMGANGGPRIAELNVGASSYASNGAVGAALPPATHHQLPDESVLNALASLDRRCSGQVGILAESHPIPHAYPKSLSSALADIINHRINMINITVIQGIPLPVTINHRIKMINIAVIEGIPLAVIINHRINMIHITVIEGIPLISSRYFHCLLQLRASKSSRVLASIQKSSHLGLCGSTNVFLSRCTHARAILVSFRVNDCNIAYIDYMINYYRQKRPINWLTLTPPRHWQARSIDCMLQQMDHHSRLLGQLVHLVAAQGRSEGNVPGESGNGKVDGGEGTVDSSNHQQVSSSCPDGCCGGNSIPSRETDLALSRCVGGNRIKGKESIDLFFHLTNSSCGSVQACVIPTAPGQVQLQPKPLDLVIIDGNYHPEMPQAGDTAGPTWA